MSRAPVLTRPATPDDAVDLVALLTELRGVEGRESLAVDPGLPQGDLGPRLLSALQDPSYRIVVACVDGGIAGMVVLAAVPLGPLTEERAINVSHLVVGHGYRRRGVGHALLAAAASYAEELGVDLVLVGAYPALREAQRWYARLGFAPLTVRRVAHVTTLRRRLAAPQRRVLVEHAARRRLARTRA